MEFPLFIPVFGEWYVIWYDITAYQFIASELCIAMYQPVIDVQYWPAVSDGYHQGRYAEHLEAHMLYIVCYNHH